MIERQDFSYESYLHDGESGLGGDQSNLQALSFLGRPLVMTQCLLPFMKITPGVISIVLIGGVGGGGHRHRRLGLKPCQQILDAGPSDVPAK